MFFRNKEQGKLEILLQGRKGAGGKGGNEKKKRKRPMSGLL